MTVTELFNIGVAFVCESYGWEGYAVTDVSEEYLNGSWCFVFDLLGDRGDSEGGARYEVRVSRDGEVLSARSMGMPPEYAYWDRFSQ